MQVLCHRANENLVSSCASGRVKRWGSVLQVRARTSRKACTLRCACRGYDRVVASYLRLGRNDDHPIVRGRHHGVEHRAWASSSARICL